MERRRVVVSICIPNELATWISELAVAKDTPRSRLFAEALRVYRRELENPGNYLALERPLGQEKRRVYVCQKR
jgi:hypothetical protein